MRLLNEIACMTTHTFGMPVGCVVFNDDDMLRA